MWDMCAMLGIFVVTCSYCKTTSNSSRGMWRCKMCGSNRGSYQTSRYDAGHEETVVVKKHWWSIPRRKKVYISGMELVFYREDKTWESPPYKPQEEDKPKTPYRSAQSIQSVLHYETLRGVRQLTGEVQCTS